MAQVLADGGTEDRTPLSGRVGGAGLSTRGCGIFGRLDPDWGLGWDLGGVIAAAASEKIKRRVRRFSKTRAWVIFERPANIGSIFTFWRTGLPVQLFGAGRFLFLWLFSVGQAQPRYKHSFLFTQHVTNTSLERGTSGTLKSINT
jgi:hypothetical protein